MFLSPEISIFSIIAMLFFKNLLRLMVTGRGIYLAQLAGTLAIIALVPTNIGKTVFLVSWWSLTFRRVSKPEIAMFIMTCLFFSGMNIASLKQGIFAFMQPDFLGMPLYEFLMWGFYLLHAKRMLGGAPPPKSLVIWLIVILYCMAFGLIPNQDVLLGVTATLLLAGLLVYHEPSDLAYISYMIFLGAAIEYTGVWSGQWAYPEQIAGGVPIWFITLWGGVGLFLRRLILPYVVTPPVIVNISAN